MSLARNVVLAFYQEAKKNTVFCAACLAKLFNLTRELNKKEYENLMKIISDLDVLIAA